MPGSWVPLNNQPTFFAGTMFLLTDGTVMCQDEGAGNPGTANWWKLTPDGSGSYINGTWTQLASGPNAPLYYASAVLQDGRVFIAGGEYNNGSSVDLSAAEIYDPVANSWTDIGTPGWAAIGDAPCAVLPDGRVLVGSIKDTRTAIYDPVAPGWTAGPNKHDSSSEETWTLLADATVLVAECSAHPAAEKYVAASNSWVNAGSVPAGHDLVQSSAASTNEIGPAIAMPDGRVFAIGASGHNALYIPPPIGNQPGTWQAAPDFPSSGGALMEAFDAPAALLPNGKVLCIAGPRQADGWSGNPSHFFEFDGTSLAAVPDPPTATGVETWQTRLLLLPTGEVMFTTGGQDIRVYQPDGSPDPFWKPSITSCPSYLQIGHSYILQGRQLNGLSQACSYGDDAGVATNYPLVRIRNLASNHVFYCRTHDHSTMAINTGMVIHSTHFDVPAGIETGSSMLCVVANGISSDCIPVNLGTKSFKDLKWEIKEIKDKDFIKDNQKTEIDVYKSLTSDFPKLKDSEGDPFRNFGDQQWQAIVRTLAERSDKIEALLQKRAFIKEEERPEVGGQALKKKDKS